MSLETCRSCKDGSKIWTHKENGMMVTDLITENGTERINTVVEVIPCPQCKYYCAPVCTFYKELPMTSRNGFCYHAIRGKYEGDTPVVKKDKASAKANKDAEAELRFEAARKELRRRNRERREKANEN